MGQKGVAVAVHIHQITGMQKNRLFQTIILHRTIRFNVNIFNGCRVIIKKKDYRKQHIAIANEYRCLTGEKLKWGIRDTRTIQNYRRKHLGGFIEVGLSRGYSYTQ
jgi:hypothetical protein